MKGELDLNGLDNDVNRLKYLPLLLKGKAVYFQESLRQAPDWATALKIFIAEFQVDPNVVIGELRALRCVDYDVNKYTDQFNAKAMKLKQTDPGLLAQLKMLYSEGLPFKIKEYLIRERDYHVYSL